MTKRMVIMLVLAGVVFGGIFGFQAFKGHMMKKFMSSMGNAPQTVSTIKAGYQEWQPQLEAVGSLRAINGVQVSPEVSGTVAALHFKQGEDVDKGQLLVELDAESEIAKLHSLQAASALAKTTYDRDTQQFQFKAVSQQTLDADKANLMQADANVAEQQALVNKKFIHALFRGRVGIRQVSVGQYVNAGTPVVSLQALDPIFLDFSVPQQNISMISHGQKVTATSDAYPGEQFTGRIIVIDPEVDATTLNVKVRAELKNPGRRLLPGMYATVDISTGKPKRYITVPQTAVTYNPYGNIAYLAEQHGTDDKGKPKLTVKQVFVTTGDTRGDQVTVLKGIKEGDVVVTAGQVKLHNGSPVTINNEVQPSNEPNPEPKDQ
ncbi:MAG TPA: efflux RND transporter periplasmic adaptor subunit [Gallionella sp.]|nr:efflux RND transporter periplasmic adaptor subunit [Gallionella sp.]